MLFSFFCEISQDFRQNVSAALGALFWGLKFQSPPHIKLSNTVASDLGLD